jgi:hypothetical protein
MEQRSAGDVGNKEEVDKFEDEEEDTAIIECRRKRTQNIAPKMGGQQQCPDTTASKRTKGARRGNSAMRVLDVSGQEAVA